MTTAGTTPPGWYDDGQGWLRWFDGSRWTEHVHGELPVTPAAALPGVGVSADAVGAAAVAGEATESAAGSDAALEVDDGEDLGDALVDSHPLMVLADPRLAEQPLYRRSWFVGSLVLVLLLTVLAVVAGEDATGGAGSPSGSLAPVAAAATSTPSASSSDSASASSSSSATPRSAPTSTPGVTKYGDWTLSSFRAQKDRFTEGFAASGRITYRGESDDAWGNFTVTLTKDGKQVASMLGAIASIERGRSKRVEFVSTDRFVPGPYVIRFQRSR